MQRVTTLLGLTLIVSIAIRCQAGESLADYTSVTGTGTLTQITGQFTNKYAALYRIHISDPASFSASTVNYTTQGVDSRLYLFTLAGVGIASNDDGDSGETRATLPLGNSLYAGLSPGDYLIGISIFDTAPYGTDSNLIFPDITNGVNGPGDTAALYTWGEDAEGNQGSYEIDFTGTTYVTAVKLNVSTTPGLAVAGVNNVNITGSGFPAGVAIPGNIVVSLATACGAIPVASTVAFGLTHILGTSYRVAFQVPAGMAPGTYFVTIRDDGSDANFVSLNCSQLIVN